VCHEKSVQSSPFFSLMLIDLHNTHNTGTGKTKIPENNSVVLDRSLKLFDETPQVQVSTTV